MNSNKTIELRLPWSCGTHCRVQGSLTLQDAIALLRDKFEGLSPIWR